MRLIDAEELLIKLQWHCDLNCPYTEKKRDVMCNACFLGADKDEIEITPTVDAIPVVRCKDCKYSEHWYGDKRRCFLWNEAGIDVFEDGYCSYGERREDDAE